MARYAGRQGKSTPDLPPVNPQTHRCPGGCGRDVPRRFVACRDDWRRLPAEQRERIKLLNATVRGSPEHFRALIDARHWYREHPSEASP